MRPTPPNRVALDVRAIDMYRRKYELGYGHVAAAAATLARARGLEVDVGAEVQRLKATLPHEPFFCGKRRGELYALVLNTELDYLLFHPKPR